MSISSLHLNALSKSTRSLHIHSFCMFTRSLHLHTFCMSTPSLPLHVFNMSTRSLHLHAFSKSTRSLHIHSFSMSTHSLYLDEFSILMKSGVDSRVVVWIKEFLLGRTLRVRVGGHLSEEVRVMAGVPQESVLGPLLFLPYVNDIWRNTESPIRLFAYDCVIYRKIINKEDRKVAESSGQVWGSERLKMRWK